MTLTRGTSPCTPHMEVPIPPGDIFYLTQDWNGLGGAIIRVGFEQMSGGQNVGIIRVTPLGHYLCQAWGTWPDIAPV